MQFQHPTLAVTPKRDDLKVLAQQTGPCLSVFLSNVARVGNGPDPASAALANAQQQINRLDLSQTERDAFLNPVRELIESDTRQGNPEPTAVFRSPTEVWHFRLPYRVSDSVTLGDRFEVRPLVKVLTEEQEFYILALSQKHCRLIHCTLADSEEVPLPSSIPTNLLNFNQTDQPDHRLENRSHAGHKGKATNQGMIIAFGTGSDADQKDQYLRNFYNALDKELQSFLREKQLPLVIAGVDYEISMYHSVSEYPALVLGGVQGAADSLRGGELHERALEILKTYNETRADRALAAFEKGPADRIPRTLPEIVPAAFDGRVLYLFVAEGYRAPGRFDESTRKTTEAPNGDDLVDTAILQTIARGGDVFMLPPEKMPGSHHIAALLRF